MPFGDGRYGIPGDIAWRHASVAMDYYAPPVSIASGGDDVWKAASSPESPSFRPAGEPPWEPLSGFPHGAGPSSLPGDARGAHHRPAAQSRPEDGLPHLRRYRRGEEPPAAADPRPVPRCGPAYTPCGPARVAFLAFSRATISR